MRLTSFLLIVLSSGCIDLSLPPLPGPPGPGTLSGRAVMVPPGRTGVIPVPNARIELLGTGLSTTSDMSGFFRLEGITRDATKLLLRADLDGDARPDRQKLLALDATRVGPGRQISLGDVLLSENAVVKGTVLLGDVPTPGGHAGTLVFVPEGPFTATTSNDGSFLFGGLPEGTISLAIFRAGYRTRSFDTVRLSSGQELTLTTVVLRRDDSNALVTLRGVVRLAEAGATPAAGATVVVSGLTERRETTTSGDGSWEVAGLAASVFSLSASRDGFRTARVSNVLAASGVVEAPELVLFPAEATGTGGSAAGGFIEGPGGGSVGGGSVGGGSSGGGSVGGGSVGGGSVGGGSVGGGSVGGGSVGGGSVGGGSVGGGSVAGGSSGGGSVGGGSVGGGSVGGGSVGGGSVGGGSVGGGSVGGGSSAGGSAGGTIVVTIPPPPTSVSAVAGDGQVRISFTASPGATSHRVYWSLQPTVSRTTGTSLGAVMSPAVHQGLANGTRHYYVVTASNQAGESAESAVVSAVPVLEGSGPPVLLARRPDIAATAIRVNTRVTARFDRDLDVGSATSANAALELPDGGVVTATVSAVGPVLSVTPAVPLAFETRYTMRIRNGLRDLGGAAVPDESWSFTTGSPAPNVTTRIGSQAVTVEWTSVARASSYLISSSRGTTTTVVSAPGSATSWTERGNLDGQLATYVVTATTPFGPGAPSTPVQTMSLANRPRAPASVTATPGRQRVLLNWPAVSGATGYSIFRAPESGGPWTLVESGNPTTTWLDVTQPSPTLAAYVVVAEAGSGQSAFSEEAVAELDSSLLAAPGGFTATAGHGWVRLSWTPVAGAQGYVLSRSLYPSGPPTRIAWVTSGTRFDDLGLSPTETYRYFVGAVTRDTVGDLAEALASPTAGLLPPAPQPGWPAISVNEVLVGSVPQPLPGLTLEVLRSSAPDGGFVPVSGVDRTVDGGTTYYYVTRFELNGQRSEFSPPIAATPVAQITPGTVENISVTVASGAADVAFDPLPNVTAYQVGRSTAPGTGAYATLCTSSDGLDTRCAVSSLTDNQTVYLAVRAVCGTVVGPWSAELMVQPTNIVSTNRAGLVRPSLIAAEGNGAITLGWTFVPSAAEYRLYRRTRVTPWQQLLVTTALAHTDTAVSNGVEYQYEVVAANELPPNQRYSPSTTSGWVRPSTLLPHRPVGVTGTPTNGGVLVRWAPIAGATRYTAWAALSPGAEVAASTSNCSTNSPWEDACVVQATNGSPVFVAVAATSPNGGSAYSDEVTVTPGGAPEAPTLTLRPAQGLVEVSTPASTGAEYRTWYRTPWSPWRALGQLTVPVVQLAAPNGLPVALRMQTISAGGVVSPFGSTTFQAADLEAPLPPQLLEVTPGVDRLFALWSVVPGTTRYGVRMGPTAVGPWTIASTSQQTPWDTSVDFFLANGQTRFLSVTAAVGRAESVGSPPIEATPAPALLAQPLVTAINGNQAVLLTWGAVPGAQGYQLLRRSSSTPWAPLATVNSLRYVDFNVENGETWVYLVRGLGPQGPAGWRETTAQAVLSSLPSAPRNVTVRPGNASAQVSWQPVPGATGYNCLSSAQVDGAYGVIASVTGGFETTCRVPVTNGTPMFFTVRAIAGTSQSVPSDPPRSTTASTSLPLNGAINSVTPGPMPGQLRVSWSAVSSAMGYRLYRRGASSPPTEVGQTGMLTFLDTGLLSGQTYTYYLETENTAGRGAWSTPSSAAAP